MPKIVGSFRSIFIIIACYSWYFQHKNQKLVSDHNRIPCFFLFIKLIEYLNFRHFRHFEILGIRFSGFDPPILAHGVLKYGGL